jgi:thymidylate kinase
MFQSKVLDEYDEIVSEFGLRVIDAAGSITEQQHRLRQLVSENLEIQKS